jgi:hypothetical protein
MTDSIITIICIIALLLMQMNVGKPTLLKLDSPHITSTVPGNRPERGAISCRRRGLQGVRVSGWIVSVTGSAGRDARRRPAAKALRCSRDDAPFLLAGSGSFVSRWRLREHCSRGLQGVRASEWIVSVTGSAGRDARRRPAAKALRCRQGAGRMTHHFYSLAVEALSASWSAVNSMARLALAAHNQTVHVPGSQCSAGLSST